MKNKLHTYLIIFCVILLFQEYNTFATDPYAKIRQSQYVSNPSLWLRKGLTEKNEFRFEIELSSLGKYRSSEVTKRSIAIYKLGESISVLPKNKAGEWCYSALHLKTGMQDGSGRIIQNVFLDNTASIRTRQEVIPLLKKFIFNQYGHFDESWKWHQMQQGEPWYSMNGHYCWHHYAAEMGADVIGSEIGENIHGTQLHIAMNRGAAKQYNKPWVIDFSSWYENGTLDYSSKSKEVWKEYSGKDKGHSMSIFERSFLMSMMAGADALIAEAGGTLAFYDKKNKNGYYILSPYGKICQKLNSFQKSYPNRGITITPCAIVLDRYHGMEALDGANHAFGIFPYNSGDEMTKNLIEMIWPETFNLNLLGGEWRALDNNDLGDNFDFFLQNVDSKLLNTYPFVILSGNLKLSSEEVSKLMFYVEQGGYLFLNQSYLNMFLYLKDKINMRDKNRFDLPYKKGLFIIYGPEYNAINIKPILKKMLIQYLPFSISAEIEYLVNIKDNEFYVTLINNDGVKKSPHSPPVIDYNAKKTITVKYNGQGRFSEISDIWNKHKLIINSSCNSASLTLGPGDSAVLLFKTNASNKQN